MHAQTAHMCIHTLHTLYVHAQVSCNKALHDTDCLVMAILWTLTHVHTASADSAYSVYDTVRTVCAIQYAYSGAYMAYIVCILCATSVLIACTYIYNIYIYIYIYMACVCVTSMYLKVIYAMSVTDLDNSISGKISDLELVGKLPLQSLKKM